MMRKVDRKDVYLIMTDMIPHFHNSAKEYSQAIPYRQKKK